MSGHAQSNVGPGSRAAVAFPFNRSLFNGAESTLAAQSEWLTTCEMTVTAWLHRRRAALQAAIDAVEHAPECRTAADLLALQQHWMAGSFRRLADDLTAWNESAMSMSRLAMRHLEQVTRLATAAGQHETQDMLRAAGNKPSP